MFKIIELNIFWPTQFIFTIKSLHNHNIWTKLLFLFIIYYEKVIT